MGDDDRLPRRGAPVTLVQAGPPAAVARGAVRAWEVGAAGLVVTARVGTTAEAVALLGGGAVWVSAATAVGHVVLSASARTIPGRHDELLLTGGTDLASGVRRAAVRTPLDRPAVLFTAGGPHRRGRWTCRAPAAACGWPPRTPPAPSTTGCASSSTSPTARPAGARPRAQGRRRAPAARGVVRGPVGPRRRAGRPRGLQLPGPALGRRGPQAGSVTVPDACTARGPSWTCSAGTGRPR